MGIRQFKRFKVSKIITSEYDEDGTNLMEVLELNYFYGILFTILGALLLIRGIFRVKIPVFKISLGVVFIFIGISLFINDSGSISDSNIIFSKRTIQVTNPNKEYNLIFSNGTIDFTKILPQNKEQKVRINTIFSSGTIIISQQTPVLIEMNSAFTITETPDKALINFGNYKYTTMVYRKDQNNLDINAKIIFSKLKIKDNSLNN